MRKTEDALVELGHSLIADFVKPCFDDFFRTHDKNNPQHRAEFNRIMNEIVRKGGSWGEGKYRKAGEAR